jgi:hypothetical protein
MALVFQYKLVSHIPGSTTTTGNASSGGASFSPNGRYLLFDSQASNLAGSDSNGGSDLFVYDTLDFSVDLVSHIPGSTNAANAPTDAAGANFSADSQYVLFDSTASNLTGSDSNAASDLFLYDTQVGSAHLVSHIPGSTTTTGNASSGGASFSPDGSYVLFDSLATDLVPPPSTDTNGVADVFRYNTPTDSIALVSHLAGASGTAANGQSSSWAFSPDSHSLLFASRATNLLSTSINPNGENLFLFSIVDQFPFVAGQTILVSHAASSATTSASNSSAVNVATFSPDGRYVLFDSLANNLVSGQDDTNGVADLFLYDTQTNSSALVSHTPGSPFATGSGGTFGTYPGGAIFSPNGEVSATPWL